MGDALALQDAGSLELDVLGSVVLEQFRSPAQQHRHDMDLEFVEPTGVEQELAVATPWTITFRSPAARFAPSSAVLTSGT